MCTAISEALTKPLRWKVTRLVGLLVFTLSTAMVGSAKAGSILVFTDRATWQAAASGVSATETFNSTTTDVVYGLNNPVTAGFLTLDVVGTASDTSWMIDAIPAGFATIPDVNGSTFVTTLYHSAFGGTRLSFAPVTAIGFDYRGASYSATDAILTTSLGDGVLFSKSADTNYAFIGILYDDGSPFSSLVWGAAGEGGHQFGAGIDNVEVFTASAVPDTGDTVYLFGLALLGLAFVASREASRNRS